MLKTTSLKIRLVNAALLISFFFLYLEWGHNRSSFMFQIFAEIFRDKGQWLLNLAHPIILSGISGVVLLLISAMRQRPHPIVNIAGILILLLIALFVLLVGCVAQNIRIVLSTLPFLLHCFYYFYIRRKSR